ncbi:hypothetical protein MIU24_32375 [Streptomyces venezuelae]|uniref:hypothetical protein n=1 Tax=Streptomyces sp. B6(2022) TaxID=3404749 RepID=UPI00311D65B7
MSSWSEERRLNNAADRAESRKDADAALDRRLKAQSAALKQQREEQAAREAEKRRKKRERKAAWKQRVDWVAVNTDLAAALAVMVAGMIPAFYFQLDALMGAGVFAGLAALLAFMLEAGAWAATAGEVKALKAGRAVWPYRVAIWTFTTAAASINFAHGLETAWWLGAILAASSVVPVALFHMVMAGRHKAKPKDATAKARAQHEKRRRRDHKKVHALAKTLVSAAPYGELQFEEAFASAWEILYGTRTLGMTPERHAQKHASRKAYATAMDEANGSPISTRGRLLEVLHPAPVELLSRPGSSQVANQVPPASTKPSETPKGGVVKEPRKRPMPPRRRKGDTLPFHPLAKAAAADTVRKLAVANGHHH